MEIIAIQVPDETAKKWKAVPANIRMQISNQFKEQIDQEAKRIQNQELFKLMDEIAAEAKKNGLTPEILEEILKDE